MSFADYDCGIEAPHRHTGEIVEGYHIEYWCPTATAWMSGSDSYGIKCVCTKPHMRARIQSISTEIIEILEPVQSVEEYIKEQLIEHFEYYLFYGEEAYKEKYGGNDGHQDQASG